MPRLYIFAEGETEQAFGGLTLTQHLAAHGVYVHGPILVAHGRRRGRVQRGGILKYQPMRTDLRNKLAEDKAPDAYVTTMIDLYRIPKDFPGLAEAESLRRSSRQRVEKLEECFAEDIGDRRFIPYIQLHEFEALLLSDPAAFLRFYENCEQQVAALQAIAGTYGTPEDIDDGPQTAPSKRIAALFPTYHKPVAGPQIAEHIGLAALRGKCPHFNDWLTKLEGLGAPVQAP